MKDPVRQGVAKAVSYARDKANIGIKLVSGDHKLTAQKVAIQQGIFRPNEDVSPFSVMSGEEFRKALTIGAQITVYDPQTNVADQIRVKENTFEEILSNIKVLSRALPSDKLMLVMGIKDKL